MLHHYLNMAKNNYREYLQGSEVKIKKYFYVLRPILACKWIRQYNAVPPISFHTLIKEAALTDELNVEIDQLLKRKLQGDELDIEPRIQIVNDFLELEMEQIYTYIHSLKTEKKNPTAILDQLFRSTLKEVWG